MKKRSDIGHILFIVKIFSFIWIVLLFSPLSFLTEANTQNTIKLGLVGYWNNDYGYFKAVKVWESEELRDKGLVEVKYAYCATSKGMVIFDIEKRVFISFVPLGDCKDIVINSEIKDNKRSIYVYMANGETGLNIINVDNPKKPYYLSNCQTPGCARSLAIVNNYVYVADENSGLQIIDISNKNMPVIVGSSLTTGHALDVAIMGNYAYVADHLSGLQIIDISNPYSPNVVGNCYVSNIAGVAIDENYAYVVDYEKDIQIIDIRSKSSPEIIGSCYMPSWALNVAIDEPYAYVIDADYGLQIIDISNRNNPRLVGSCYIHKSPWALDAENGEAAIDGDFAYVAAGSKGLQIIDLKNRRGMVIKGICETFEEAHDVAIDGNFAYVADGFSGLQVISIADPNDPVIVGTCNTPGWALGIDIAGDYACMADGYGGLQIIDIADPDKPVIVSNCVTPYWAWRVVIAGDYAYVASGNTGLHIIDISDIYKPMIIGSCDTPEYVQDVAVDGDFAYLADTEGGLKIVNITDPTEPVIIGSLETIEYAQGLDTDGSYVYLIDYGDDSDTFQIIDVSSKESPEILGFCYIYEGPGDVTVRGDYAYVACGNGGLFVIDIRQKHHPKIVGHCYTSDAESVVVINGYAYVAGQEDGLVIFDLTDKNGPQIVGDYETDSLMDVTIHHNFAYVASGYSGVQIIDIDNRNGPLIIDRCDTPGSAEAVAVESNYAYVADGYGGLQAINISNPERPIIIGSCEIQNYAMDVAISGNYASVAVMDNGLQIIKITDPNRPMIVGHCESVDAQRVVIEGKYAYVVGYWFNDLQIVDIRDSKNPEIVGVCGDMDAMEVAVNDDYAYVIGWESKSKNKSLLYIVNISNKENPEIISSCNIPAGLGQGIVIDGNYAYTTDEGGLLVIDISNKYAPVIVESYKTFEGPCDLAIDGNYIYVLEKENGIQKLRINTGLSTKGNLILVAGGIMDYQHSYFHATQTVSNHIFNTFINQAYEVYDIYCLNPVGIQDTDNDGIPNQLVVDDPTPTKEGETEGLKYAVTDWALEENLNTGPLYICLIGHGAKDRFQVMPNEVLRASELKDYIDAFHDGNSDVPDDPDQSIPRPVVVLLEFGASGSFMDDLVSDSNDPNHIIVISSTDQGASYIKPDTDPNSHIPISFTSLLMNAIQENYDHEDYQSALKDAFISAREQLYNQGPPFLEQAPQMYVPHGPFAFTLIPDDPSLAMDPLIITQAEPVALYAVARYPDGATIALDPHGLRFLSSNRLVLDPNDPEQLQITSEQIHILPDKNGLTGLIAYPDPGLYPDILLTARVPMEVSIPGNKAAGGDKAIIVAGYRADQGMPDNLWESTNTIANHAYQSLRKKRYSREDIFYLNPHHFQDVDRNLKYDDIDGYPGFENLYRAFDQIGESGARELLIFLVDHGNPGTFNLNPQDETGLSVERLAERICSAAPEVQENITVLIDACYSGSFIPHLHQQISQNQADPNQVILITSSGADQPASFLADGLISFSYPFFDQFLLTNSLLDAFSYSSYFLPPSGQIPHIYDQNTAKKRDKNLVYYIDEARPAITERDLYRKDGVLRISAQVFSISGIEHVWALITSCEEGGAVTEGGPKTDDPVITLLPEEPNIPYGGWYRTEVGDPYPDAFNYQVLLSAKDATGKVTTERTNISSQEKNSTGAIILVTHLQAVDETMSMLLDDQSHKAYRILKEKGIQDEDIYYIKSAGIYTDEDPDSLPKLSAIQEDIHLWLQEKGYHILLIYLVGETQTGAQAEADFILNQTQSLLPEDIPNHINPPQGCQVLLLCETSDAQGFLKNLPLKSNWVSIASPYMDYYRPLFSYFFFSRLYCFDTVGEAYEKAYKAFSPPQRPSDYIYFFDDFVPSSFRKIKERLGYYLGNPAIMGEDLGLIKTTQVLEEESYITLRLKVNESSQVNTPWAELRTPSGAIYHSLLYQTGEPSSWGLSLERDLPYSGVALYVEQTQEGDQPGIIDWREHPITRFLQGLQEDPHEPDDTPETPWPIAIDIPQDHTFHNPNDIDWVYFFGHRGEIYEINANDINGWGYFIRMSLYDPNESPLQTFYNNLSGWECPQDGYYSLKVESATDPNEGAFGYSLLIEYPYAPTPDAGLLGRVVMVEDNESIGVNGLDVYVGTSKTSTVSQKNVKNQALDPSMIDGWFFIENLLAPGWYEVLVTAKDDPDTVLADPFTIYLQSKHVCQLDDAIIINQDLYPQFSDPNKADVAGFEALYNKWQKELGKQYPIWEDSDNDGFTNKEEFLNGTHPDHPTFQYTFYPGLNLFPFYLSDSSTVDEFCSEKLDEWQSIRGYDPQNRHWNAWNINMGGNNFPMGYGKGYLIYKQYGEVIYQDQQTAMGSMNPGINIIGVSPSSETSTYTSFQFLKERRSEGVKNISRYNNAPKGQNKGTGRWESSYWFFGGPSGTQFPIVNSEAFLIHVK